MAELIDDDELEILDENHEVVGGEENKISRLETEGEYAADYLEELLDIADLDGDIEIDVENGRAIVEIVADEESSKRLSVLVGRDGAVLDSLQELTRLAVQNQTGDRSRLMLDVAGFRAKRREALREVVAQAILQLEESGEEVRLDPMNPFERKVCHDAIAAAGLFSHSQGVEPERYIVITSENAQ